MSFVCIRNRVLCPMDGRCPACTVARMQLELSGARSREQALRCDVMALEWGLAQTQRHVLRTEGSDLRVAKFVAAVLDTRDADPAHLELLK